ncbi:MAG: nitrate reductase, partial [Comamonadaceae bacterium]
PHRGLVGHGLGRVGAGYPQRLDLAVGGGLEHLHRGLAGLFRHAGYAPKRSDFSPVLRIGHVAVEMFQAAADGEIKALWIACTNPAQSMPDQATVRRALERAELVVVQEAFSTAATCAYADLLLPATSWGEKTGTVTNSERRVSRVRPAVAAPGGARHDWAIAVEFAQRLEARLRPGQPTLFPYALHDSATGVETIWNEHRESTRGRDLDITGMSYALLEQSPLQWPMPAGATRGKERLYEDGVFPTPDGRARFADTVYRPVAEPRESRFPFSLTTGRLRDQWHGMTRTGAIGRLFGHVAEPSIQMHPQDMQRRQLADGDLVHVTSKRGSIVVPAQASQEIGLSQAFMAMHWGSEYLSGCSSTGAPLAGVNALTTSAYCPSSKQPELKHAAVKILKAELPWSLLAVAWLDEGNALAARSQLAALMARFPFATCVPFSSNTPLSAAGGGVRAGVLFRAASHEAPPDELLERIERLLGLAGADVLRYADRKRGQRRAIRLLRADGGAVRLEGFVLAGDTSAQTWIKTLLQEELPAEAYGRLLLLPGAKPPVAVQARGRQVCTCFNVTEPAIQEQLAHSTGFAADRLEALQAQLKCGTNCGSCVPELKRMVRAVMPLTETA